MEIEEVRLTLPALVRQSRNTSNLGNKKRKVDDLQRSLALLCLVAVD